ncbi:hypothetical protein, partial [Aeromonas sanarellii]
NSLSGINQQDTPPSLYPPYTRNHHNSDRKLKDHKYAASPEGSGTNAAISVMNLTYPGEAPRTPTGEGKGSDQGMVNTDVPAGVQEGKRPVTPDEQLPLWKR